jgi:hypothetical protein
MTEAWNIFVREANLEGNCEAEAGRGFEDSLVASVHFHPRRIGERWCN